MQSAVAATTAAVAADAASALASFPLRYISRGKGSCQELLHMLRTSLTSWAWEAATPLAE